MKKGLIIIVLALCGFLAKAQLITTNAAPFNTPAYLVNDVLLGQGIVASNISFTGTPNAIGFFNGVNSNIGLDSGIVITSEI